MTHMFLSGLAFGLGAIGAVIVFNVLMLIVTVLCATAAVIGEATWEAARNVWRCRIKGVQR